MARLVQGAPSLSRTHLSSCVPDLPPRYYVTTRRVASVKLSRAWQLVVYQVICFHIAIFFHSKEIRREKTISIWSRFVRQTSDAPARYKIHGNRYTSRVSTRMRTYFQIIESNETNLIWVVQKYTRVLNLIINCKNFETFFWSINNHMYINNDLSFI